MKDKSAFLRFLRLITLKGQIENNEAVLDVSANSIKALLKSSDKTFALEGILNENINAVGEVGIDDLPNIVNLLNSLNDDFDFKFTRDTLTVKNAKSKMTRKLRSASYVVNKVEKSVFDNVKAKSEGGIQFKLTPDVYKDIVSKFKLIKSEELIIGSNGTELIVRSKNTNDETEFETYYSVGCKEKFIIKINKSIIDLFDLLDNTVDVRLSKDSPTVLNISYSTDKIKIDYLIALLTEK